MKDKRKKTMKKSIIILVVLSITLSSCIDKILGHKYVATIDNARIMLEKIYAKDGLLERWRVGFVISAWTNRFIY